MGNVTEKLEVKIYGAVYTNTGSTETTQMLVQFWLVLTQSWRIH